jgi:hypothetical protein
MVPIHGPRRTDGNACRGGKRIGLAGGRQVKGTGQLSEQEIAQWAPAGPFQAFNVVLAALEKVDLCEGQPLAGDLIQAFAPDRQAISDLAHLVQQTAHALRRGHAFHQGIVEVAGDEGHLHEDLP